MAIRIVFCVFLIFALSGCAAYMNQYASCKSDCDVTYADCIKAAPQANTDRALMARQDCRSRQDHCLNYCKSQYEPEEKPDYYRPPYDRKWPPDWP